MSNEIKAYIALYVYVDGELGDIGPVFTSYDAAWNWVRKEWGCDAVKAARHVHETILKEG